MVQQKVGRTEEQVKHPQYYTQGKIEVWDFISDQGLNYDRGAAIKYICRAGKKYPEKEIEDLEKAINYLEHEKKIVLENKGIVNN